MENEYKTIEVSGFDSNGEPEIKVTETERIEIMFNFMPPVNGNDDQIKDDDYWDNFEKIISEHLETEVLRDDRESFIIESAPKGTAKKLKEFLDTYWENH
jgi:hypothetical protein